MELVPMLCWYLKGLVIVAVMLPIVAAVYDPKAFTLPNWAAHMIVMAIAYPVTIPVLISMRLAR